MIMNPSSLRPTEALNTPPCRISQTAIQPSLHEILVVLARSKVTGRVQIASVVRFWRVSCRDVGC